MNNRPYLSETSNIYNENFYNTVPAQFGNNNLMVSHGQHRKIVDTTTTSITGQNPQFNNNVINPQSFQQPLQYPGQRQLIPHGVTYTFDPSAQNGCLRNFTDTGTYFNRNNNQNINAAYQQQLSLQQQLALNQLQKHALESMILHEQFKENPFKLQFHKDGQTDTGDLFQCPDYCMSKKTLLKPLQYNENNFRIGGEPPKPERLFPEYVKKKQLRINPVSKHFEDKSIQYSPLQESIETQANTITPCMCKEKEYSTIDNQTETKKVTFDEANAYQNKCKIKKKTANLRKSRSVDEDSSDSDISSSSKSSDDNNI